MTTVVRMFGLGSVAVLAAGILFGHEPPPPKAPTHDSGGADDATSGMSKVARSASRMGRDWLVFRAEVDRIKANPPRRGRPPKPKTAEPAPKRPRGRPRKTEK